MLQQIRMSLLQALFALSTFTNRFALTNSWLRKLLTQQIYSRIKHPTSQYNPTKRTRTPEGMYTQTNVASQLSEWCIAGIEKGQATKASSDSLIALHFGHCL